MESLAEIMARVERLVFAQEQERSSSPTALPPSSSEGQAALPLVLPVFESPLPPEYIQAEVFLEVSGYFTPSSKRIRSIYTKEKKLREYIDEQGKKRTLKTKISANYERSYWIPGSWNVRMVYTDAIPFYDPCLESNG